MQVEILQCGFQCQTEHPIKVLHKGIIVGEYFADLYMNNAIIVELKVAKKYNPNHQPQLLNELKATGTKWVC